MNIDDVAMVGTLKAISVDFRRSMGKLYAFVECVDLLRSGKGTGKARYWGEVPESYDESDIVQVISYGGKWDNLP